MSEFVVWIVELHDFAIVLWLGLLESRPVPGRVLHNPFEKKKKPKTRLGE